MFWIFLITGSDFYSTYKELKYGKSSVVCRYRKDFYSTYKELKFEIEPHDIGAFYDFYSTYKELKFPFLPKTFLSDFSIFTLPIRNWNWHINIGNCKYSTHIFTLPIRNWNFNSLLKSDISAIHFYSTYKELKLIVSCNKAPPIAFIFTLPIRNWNLDF